MHRRRQQVVFTVDAETLVILNQVIDETNLSLGKVIDLIVQEWREKEIIDPFKSTSESQDLSKSAKTDIYLKLSKKLHELYQENQLFPPKDSIEDRMTYIESWFSILYDEIMELPIWDSESE